MLKDYEKIFIDMDGVLADFDGAFKSAYGELPPKHMEPKNKENVRKDMVRNAFFMTMPYFPLLEILVKNKDKLKQFGICILSATGGTKSSEIKDQKLFWLNSAAHAVDPTLPIDSVPFVEYFDQLLFTKHSEDKGAYATPNAILVDDRDKCLIPFAKNGGAIMKFTNSKEQLRMFEELFSSAQ